MKNSCSTLFFTLLLVFLFCVPATAFQAETAEETTPAAPIIIGEGTIAPTPVPTITKTPFAEVLNPLTGLPVADPDLLLYSPVFIPITRFPSGWRPSAGISQAPWTFELYVNKEESRPILMFYGSLPTTTAINVEPYIGHLSSALFGLESLRRQYHGIIIAGGTSKSVLDSDIMNLELWYGLTGWEQYPNLPVGKMQKIMEKWKKIASPADPNNMYIPFSETPPEGGIKATSVYMHYARVNKILWEYDENTHLYLRSQNSNEIPLTLAPDIDQLNEQQVAVDNLIILQANYSLVDIFPNDSSYFTVNFNYVEKNPAIIFRDGQLYNAYWTTQSELFERESQRMRPIRFIDENGNLFPLKPGQTWVHVTMPGNPCYEVDEKLGSVLSEGSGYWKIPYISFKKGSEEAVRQEVPELAEINYTINN